MLSANCSLCKIEGGLLMFATKPKLRHREQLQGRALCQAELTKSQSVLISS